MKQLRVDDIKTDRDVDAAEPLQGLTQTFKQPILVLEDGTLVDGLRRLQAARTQGLEYVPVTVLTNFIQATEILTKVHEGRPCKPRRAWEIMSALEPMSKSWAYAQRAHNIALMRRGEREKGQTRAVGTRSLVRKAVGLTYDQVGDQIRSLYRKAERGDPRAIELVARIDSGTMTPGMAYGTYMRNVGLSGDIVDKSHQKTLLDTGPQRLSSVMQSLTRLGSPVSLDPDLIRSALKSLTESRSQLTTLINHLRKELPE